MSNEDLMYDVEFMTCTVDREDSFKVVDCDSHFCDFSGVHPSKIDQGKLKFLDLIPDKDRERFINKFAKKDIPYVYMDFYVKRKDGNLVFMHCCAVNNKKSFKTRLFLADVSKDAEKTKQLQDQARDMNYLIDLVSGGVMLFRVSQNMEFKVLFANEGFAQMLQVPKTRIIGSTSDFADYFHSDDRSQVFTQIGKAMATKKPVEVEVRMKQSDGKYLWVQINAEVQEYDGDMPVFHAMITDINRAKQAEEEAEKQALKLTTIFKNMPGPVFTAPLNNPFVVSLVSSDFMSVLGYTRKEFFEKHNGNLQELIMERDYKKTVSSIKRQAENGKELSVEYEIKNAQGKFISVRDVRKVVETLEGDYSTIGMIYNISER